MSDKPQFIVETKSADFIPSSMRHGKVSDLFYIWFGANMVLPVVTAGAIVVVTGFSLLWAIIAIIVGALIGGLLMAFHSAQGPHLGLPQMIQSRAQFGYSGAAFPLIFAVALYLGFFAAGGVLIGQALKMLVGVSTGSGIALGSILSLAVAIFGYNIIHRYEQYFSYFVGALFAVFTILLIVNHPFINPHPLSGTFQLGPFLLAVEVAATSQLGYAVYVADYSRYLPESTSIKGAFWYTYAGVSLSGLWLMILGAVLQARTGLANPVGELVSIADSVGRWFGTLTLLAIILGLISINAMNIYGGFMSSLTAVSTFVKLKASGLSLRVWFLVPVAAADTIMSFLYKSSLFSSFETFLVIILAFLIPWTAINLTDFYFVRKGHYEPEALLNDNGTYGKFNAPGLVAYIIGFVIQVPFMNNPVVEGPIAHMLNNGDVSWVVGALVAGPLYYALARRQGVAGRITSGVRVGK